MIKVSRGPRGVSLVVAAISLVATGAVDARVTKITIQTTTPVANTGPVGAYEQLRGQAEGEIDPLDRRNSGITDIEFAPRNANGKVTYTAQFTLLKPVDMSLAGGILLEVIPNRGGIATPYGTDLIFQYGEVVLNVAWQGDIPIAGTTGALGIDVPRATGVVSKVWDRFIAPTGLVQSLPEVSPGRALATMDTTQASLISFTKESPEGVKSGVVVIPSTDFAFANCTAANPFPGTPSATQLCIRGGFNNQLGYELIRLAKDPLVLGVGEAAMRDVTSFFRYAAADDVGTANPVAGKVRYALNFGNSQSGRLGKHWLNAGFNEDETVAGRMVLDGMNPNIAGMMGSFNIRFAKEGDIAEMYDPGSTGSLWWADYVDTVRGLPAWGLLHRCTQTNTCPKIMETYGGPEMWYSHGSVGIAGTKGNEDLPVPSNVRRYYHPGTAHGGGSGGWNIGTKSSNPLTLAGNPNPQTETNRALHVAMIEWVRNGTLPPPSAYPRVSDGTLVAANSASLGWPNIPATPKPDGVMNPVLWLDYGPSFRYNDGSGVITNDPPVILGVIPSLAPKQDIDGNEIAGVRSLLHRMPLGTYTGWNPIGSGPLAGREGSLASGYIPFPKTAAERIALGDPRLSIVERYGSLGNYVYQSSVIAKSLIAQRLLLPQDAITLLNQMKTQMPALLPLLP